MPARSTTAGRRACLAAGAALGLLPYAVMVYWLAAHRSPLVAVDYAAVVFAVLILLALVAGTVRRLHAVHAPLFFVTLIFTGYAIVSGELAGYPIAFVLETSSWEEVRGFFGTWQQQKLLLLVLLAAVAYIGVGLGMPSRYRLTGRPRATRWIAIGTFGVAAALAALDSDQFIQGAAATPILGSVLFINGPLSSANLAVNGAHLRKRPYGATRHGGREIHILVVGESSRRASWSAYGYSRPTTPFMEALKHEAIFLDNARSDANVTVYAVPMLLTGAAPETFSLQTVHGNLIDLAKEAGYHSSWLANQDAGISYLVGMAADESFYTFTVSKPTYVVYPPDEVLLPELSKQLSRPGSPLFIALHVFGSHAPYANRFPKSFDKFGDEALDTYDDAILYTDWFLEQVMELARRIDVPATVTYVSDHGEDLYALDGRSGHGLGDYSQHAFDIPAFVWMNDAYRKLYPDRVRALTDNAHKRIRSHDFFYTEAHLMGIQWSGAVPQRSFASPLFSPDVKDRFVAGGNLVVGAD